MVNFRAHLLKHCTVATEGGARRWWSSDGGRAASSGPDDGDGNGVLATGLVVAE